MAGKSRLIKNAIMEILQGIQHESEPAFVEVLGHPRGQFDAEPIARVLPADQTAENVAFAAEDRGVNLTVRIGLNIRNDGSEFDYMYDLTDLVMDALGEADYANALPDDIGAFILTASRGDWFDDDSQGGPKLMCDIAVSVTYSKEL